MYDSIVSAIRENAIRHPEQIAIIADDEKVNYAELWRQIQGFAAYIRGFGFEKGSRIVVKSAPSIWFAVAAFSIHLSGNVHVPLEKTIGAEGLDSVAGELSAAMIISNVETRLETPRVDSGEVRNIADTYYRDGLDFEFPTPDMTCDILFTTGTTGKSKGVMESHRAVVSVTENVQYGSEIPEGNVYLVPAPINHASGIRKLYVSMLTGTTVVLLDGYTNVKKFYECIREYGVTSILMPPSAVRMLLMLSAGELAKYSKQLSFIHTSTAPLPEADKERLCSILPDTRLYFAYGSSEAGCVSMFDYSRHRGRISCVGRPNRNAHIFIVDDDRREIDSSREKQGLIAISGPVVMQGYFNEPELTAEVLQDGVIYTNDIGYIDDEGFVYMLGRRGDVINIGGLKIAPTEVEDVVLRFPGVAQCACFAVEDRMGGSVPKLNVVPEMNGEIDIKALKDYMARHLEAYKIPKLIDIVEDIPKTSNGKIDRKRLK